MSTAKPKPGERWRVTLEGVVEDVERGTTRVVFLAPGSAPVVYDHAARGDWERLPDPEPEWEFGAVVVDANGTYWYRNDEAHWVGFGSDLAYFDHHPARPLRRLVEEDSA